MILLLLLAACSVFQTPCQNLYDTVCAQCDVDDYTKAFCACIENGEGKPGDYPDNYDISEEDAKYDCEITLATLRTAGSDSQGQCQAQYEVLNGDDEACVPLGYEREERGGRDTG